MITDKRVLSLEEKERLILKWEQSGLSQLEFCLEEGISRKLFSRWKRKRDGKLLPENTGEFLSASEPESEEPIKSVNLKLPNGIELTISY